MKTMKSYRMDDMDLAMIDAIKAETGLKSDTAVIGTAIIELYYKTCRNASLSTILKDGDRHDKS